MRATFTAVSAAAPGHLAGRVAGALAGQGFQLARSEADYVEARRGRIRPMGSALLQARRPVSDAPVVVCVALAPTATGTAVKAAAYPDLGPGVVLGPVSRRTFRRATQAAVDVVAAVVARAEQPSVPPGHEAHRA